MKTESRFLVCEGQSPEISLSEKVSNGTEFLFEVELQSFPEENLRFAINLCHDDFTNVLMHLVFQRAPNTQGFIYCSSRHLGEWTGFPGLKFPCLLLETEQPSLVSVQVFSDGICVSVDGHKLFEQEEQQKRIPFYSQHKLQDINKLIISGQHGRAVVNSVVRKDLQQVSLVPDTKRSIKPAHLRGIHGFNLSNSLETAVFVSQELSGFPEGKTFRVVCLSFAGQEKGKGQGKEQARFRPRSLKMDGLLSCDKAYFSSRKVQETNVVTIEDSPVDQDFDQDAPCIEPKQLQGLKLTFADESKQTLFNWRWFKTPEGDWFRFLTLEEYK